MDIHQELWGVEDQLSTVQMTIRAVLFFLYALVLVRISGRRSFGQKMPMDNIIVILLGAILSRAIVGASPVVPITVASLAIVLLHRLLAMLAVHSQFWSGLIKGEKMLLVKDGKANKSEMEKALVSDEDLAEGIRSSIKSENIEDVETAYMERNGQISVIPKKK